MKKNIIGLLALSLIVVSAEAAKKVGSECIDNAQSIQDQNIKTNKKITFVNNSGDVISFIMHFEDEEGKTGTEGITVNAHEKYIIPYCFSARSQKVTFVKDADYLLEKVGRHIDEEVNRRMKDKEFIKKNYPQKSLNNIQDLMDISTNISMNMYKNEAKNLHIADTLKKLSNTRSFNLVITINDMNEEPVIEIKK